MKNFLVTGASRGIGRAIATHLVSLGHQVHGTYNSSQTEAEALKKTLGSALTLHQVNFCERTQTEAFLKSLSGLQFDGIVNNAGIIEFEDTDNFDMTIWDRTLEVNVTTPLLITQHLRKQMTKNGAVVNIASTDGLTGTFASISYAASKAALINLTKALGNILGQTGLRANAVAPGWINTGMSTVASKEAVHLTPLGRNGTPEDVAKVVTFLLSPESSYINGACIIVDGGYTNVDSIMMREAKGEI